MHSELEQNVPAASVPSLRPGERVNGLSDDLAHRLVDAHGQPRPRRGEQRAAQSAGSIVGLQRTAGNRAVVQLLGPEHEESPVLDVVGKGGGAPLDGSLQTEMSERMGADFSGVRIHTDAKASDSAAAVQARAYTVGNEIVFGRGAYAPDTHQGRHTIAHELTHVIQQSRGPVSGTDTGQGVAVSDPSDSFEQAAEDNAFQVMRQELPAEGEEAEDEET